MLVCIPGVLDREALAAVRARLDAAGDAWVDGRVTAGHQGAPVKFNQQIDEGSAVAHECQAIVASALERHPTFISAALPNPLYPPMFNRYSEGMRFGLHVDGGVRIDPRTVAHEALHPEEAREPHAARDGRHLVQAGGGVEHHVAGCELHGLHAVRVFHLQFAAVVAVGVRQEERGRQVGAQLADAGDRALLFDMDNAVQRLNQSGADESARRTLVGTYHNLLCKWSET